MAANPYDSPQSSSGRGPARPAPALAPLPRRLGTIGLILLIPLTAALLAAINDPQDYVIRRLNEFVRDSTTLPLRTVYYATTGTLAVVWLAWLIASVAAVLWKPKDRP